ncbi:putative short transmembrane mitochondrial protein [Helianthus debilis subsp. tardiflorus]
MDINHPTCIRSNTRSEMGIIRSSFSFMLGTGFGIYVAQNYDVPNIHKLYKTGLVMVNHYEQNYRKPKATSSDDHDHDDGRLNRS